MKLNFKHLIEALGDLRGIECVLGKHTQRKTSGGLNLNRKKKYTEKAIYFGLGEILTE